MSVSECGRGQILEVNCGLYVHGACVCTCSCVWVHMRVTIFGGHRSMLDIFLNHSLLYFEIGSLTILRAH